MLENLELFRRFYLSSKPVYLIQYVTARCNLRCKMCFYMEKILKSDKTKELSLDEFQKIAQNFSHLIQVSIGGGEPFIREDLDEIMYVFKKTSGAKYFTLPTNGTFPERTERFLRETLPRLYPAHLRISLSLDGIGDDHDRIRGIEGTFERFTETYKRISPLRKKYSNFSLDIVTTCSALNHENIEQIYNYTQDNFDVDNIGLLYVRGDTDERVKQVFLKFYRDTYIKIDKYNVKKKENRHFSNVFRAISAEVHDIVYNTILYNKYYIPCEAGKRILVISEEGVVSPCEILPVNFGNLRDCNFDLQRMLAKEEVREVVQSIKKNKCFCTFECAHSLNVIFHKKLKILSRFILSSF